MSKTLVAAVAFSIDGAFIAEHARGLVIAGKWRTGLEMLVEDLGMAYEQAFLILSGEKTLTGNSAEDNIFMVDVEPGDQEVGAYLGNLGYMYAGLWKHGEHTYQPYARVNSYDENDIQWAAERYAPEWNARRTMDVPFAVLRGRVEYYAETEDSDIATLCGRFSKYMVVHDQDRDFITPSNEGGYLWKRVHDLPLWVKPHKTADEALTAYLSRRARSLRLVDSVGVEHLRWTLDSIPAEIPMVSISDNILKTADQFYQEAEQAVVEIEKLVEEVAVDPQEEKRRRYEARIAREKKADEEREAKRQKAIQGLRDEIREANGNNPDDWIRIPILADDMNDKNIREWLSVPRKPFLRWVYNRSPAYRLSPDLVPEWKVISPVGLKMYGDDPVHTDWVIGSGLDPEAFYADDCYNNSTYRKRMDILRDTLGWDIEVFSGSGWLGGDIKILAPGEVLTKKDQIGVIANGSMEYDAALRSAIKYKSAIIMAVGGKLCHAATVARESDLRLVMWPQAMDLKDGDHIWLNLDARTLSVSAT